jgi:tetratricopeptide (TPR) repeat protein
MTLTHLSSLGDLQKQSNQLPRAEATYLEVLARQTKALGANHPDQFGTLSALAEVYQAAGEATKALAQYKRQLDLELPKPDAPGMWTTACQRRGKPHTSIGQLAKKLGMKVDLVLQSWTSALTACMKAGVTAKDARWLETTLVETAELYQHKGTAKEAYCHLRAAELVAEGDQPREEADRKYHAERLEKLRARKNRMGQEDKSLLQLSDAACAKLAPLRAE